MVIIVIDNNGNVSPITTTSADGTVTIKQSTPAQPASSTPQTGAQAGSQDNIESVKKAPTQEIPLRNPAEQSALPIHRWHLACRN